MAASSTSKYLHIAQKSVITRVSQAQTIKLIMEEVHPFTKSFCISGNCYLSISSTEIFQPTYLKKFFLKKSFPTYLPTNFFDISGNKDHFFGHGALAFIMLVSVFQLSQAVNQTADNDMASKLQ